MRVLPPPHRPPHMPTCTPTQQLHRAWSVIRPIPTTEATVRPLTCAEKQPTTDSKRRHATNAREPPTSMQEHTTVQEHRRYERCGTPSASACAGMPTAAAAACPMARSTVWAATRTRRRQRTCTPSQPSTKQEHPTSQEHQALAQRRIPHRRARTVAAAARDATTPPSNNVTRTCTVNTAAATSTHMQEHTSMQEHHLRRAEIVPCTVAHAMHPAARDTTAQHLATTMRARFFSTAAATAAHKQGHLQHSP